MEPGVSDLPHSKLKLLSLIGKTQDVIRFASPQQCDEALVELATFYEAAASRREHAISKSSFALKSLSDLLQEQSKGLETTSLPTLSKKRRKVCQCKPFSASCEPHDLNAESRALCQCCSESNNRTSTFLDLQSPDDYCADCLCSLSNGPTKMGGGEEEFDMMMTWTAVHDEQWSWIPVVYDEFGVFRSLWIWLHDRGLCDQFGLHSIEALVTEIAREALRLMEDSLNESLCTAWTTVSKDPARARELMATDGFINSVWFGVFKLIPFLSCISIYYVSRSSKGLGMELCLLEEHWNTAEVEAKEKVERIHFLVWNRHVAPQYDVLVPKA